jgi:hypothetical protein
MMQSGMCKTPRVALVVAALLVAFAGCEREKKGIKEDLPATRMVKAQADAATIVGAIRTYSATCGQLPESLEDLTTLKTVGGGPCGPFLQRIPAPPTGWEPYAYAKAADGSFSVSSSGPGGSVRVP